MSGYAPCGVCGDMPAMHASHDDPRPSQESGMLDHSYLGGGCWETSAVATAVGARVVVVIDSDDNRYPATIPPNNGTVTL